MLEYPLLLVFPAAMAIAGVFDLLTMTIPNRISLALVAAFCIAAPLSGLSLETTAIHVGVGLAVLAVGISLFAMGWLGGGDAKLLAAASLWIGWDGLVIFLAQVAVLGGVLAVAVLVYRMMPIGALPLTLPEWARRLHKKGNGIPYGVAIAGAALLLYPKTAWFAAFTT